MIIILMETLLFYFLTVRTDSFLPLELQLPTLTLTETDVSVNCFNSDTENKGMSWVGR